MQTEKSISIIGSDVSRTGYVNNWEGFMIFPCDWKYLSILIQKKPKNFVLNTCKFVAASNMFAINRGQIGNYDYTRFKLPLAIYLILHSSFQFVTYEWWFRVEYFYLRRKRETKLANKPCCLFSCLLIWPLQTVCFVFVFEGHRHLVLTNSHIFQQTLWHTNKTNLKSFTFSKKKNIPWYDDCIQLLLFF